MDREVGGDRILQGEKDEGRRDMEKENMGKKELKDLK